MKSAALYAAIVIPSSFMLAGCNPFDAMGESPEKAAELVQKYAPIYCNAPATARVVLRNRVNNALRDQQMSVYVYCKGDEDNPATMVDVPAAPTAPSPQVTTGETK